MQKRWGSHTASGRIILNDRLIAARRDCIDYVIRSRNVPRGGAEPFGKILPGCETFSADWEQRKELLERSMA